MKISIVVPCYNCEKTIKRSIDSLLAQTHKDIEVVLVDDGSTDGTYDCIKEYNDPRIICIRQKNGGALLARKTGVLKASGEYIMFCDADDYCDPDLVEKVHSTISANPVDIVSFGSITHYPSGKTTAKKSRLKDGYYNRNKIDAEILPTLYFNGKFYSHLFSTTLWSKAFRSALIKQAISAVDETIRFQEDTLINFVAINSADSLIMDSTIAGYHFLRNTASQTGKFNPNYKELLDSYYYERIRLTEVCKYPYTEQIYCSAYCGYLLYIKKIFVRSPLKRKDTIDIAKTIAESDIFVNCKKICSIKDFSVKEKVFAALINRGSYRSAYFLTKLSCIIPGYNI